MLLVMITIIITGCSEDLIIIDKSSSSNGTGDCNCTNTTITNNITNNNYYNVSNSSFTCSGTDKLNNVSILNGAITGVCGTDQTGGGSSTLTAWQLLDNAIYFSRYDFESVTAGYTERWVPTAIVSGTTAVVDGKTEHPGIVSISNGVPANGGYSYQLSNAGAYQLYNDYFTILTFNLTCNAVVQNVSNLSHPINGTNMRFGFQDIFTVADPTDGCYLNVTNKWNLTSLQINGVCKNNNVATRTLTNYTLLNKTWYTGMVYVHNVSNLVKFYIYNGAGDTLVWSDNVTTNIPNLSTRVTSHALVVWRNGNSSARVQGQFDYMGVGINRSVTR
jgi:hypothetical protein